jgi:hypothetical protein
MRRSCRSSIRGSASSQPSRPAASPVEAARLPSATPEMPRRPQSCGRRFALAARLRLTSANRAAERSEGPARPLLNRCSRWPLAFGSPARTAPPSGARVQRGHFLTGVGAGRSPSARQRELPRHSHRQRPPGFILRDCSDRAMTGRFGPPATLAPARCSGGRDRVAHADGLYPERQYA